MIRKATDKQIEYGKILGLSLKSKSFRVADAMIADEIEKRCWEAIKKQNLMKGDRVKYMGNYKSRKNKIFTVSTIGKGGLVYFFRRDKMGKKMNTYAYAFYLKKIKN